MVQRFNEELKKSFLGFTPEAADLIVNYSWPGNIRELKNVVERTMILAPEGNIDSISLPEEIRESKNLNHVEAPPNDGDPGGDFLVSLRELEEDYIRKVLAATGNNKTQAAKILGIHPTSLLRRLKKEPALNCPLFSQNGITPRQFPSRTPFYSEVHKKKLGMSPNLEYFCRHQKRDWLGAHLGHIRGQLKCESSPAVSQQVSRQCEVCQL